ncbi:MAG: class I SAM-dependent methyltransferase [Burkholderiales bacterium]|jgi:arsenite methyltransferase
MPTHPSHEDSIRQRSIAKYATRAAGYDATTGPTASIRARTIARLGLTPGQSVLDVGCGTGLSLAPLREQVQAEGRVYGCDQSPHMLKLACARVAQADWRNVTLFETAAQDLRLPEPVDALLFHYAHDILRSQVALDALLAQARPGAVVAVAGIKYFSGVLRPLNPWVYWKNSGYNGHPGELRSPWDRLAPRLQGWSMTETQWGMGYIGVGHVPK